MTMNSIHSEFLKLKRSMSWAVVLVVPIIMVLAGSMSTMLAQGTFEDGWHTLWIRSVGFYGMAILPVAVAILASLVWRVEHKNSNWNALMSRPVPTSEVVLGKVAAIAALAASMQLVLLVTVIGLGKLVFGLEGMLPAKYLLGSPLIMLACVPAAVIGLALNDWIDEHFYNPWTVALALITFGVAFIAVENRNQSHRPHTVELAAISYKQAFWVGMFQVIAAVFPGTSRSGATILGGIAVGLSRAVAAEFTFFLAVPVMFGASLLKIVKHGLSFSGHELAVMGSGMLVSFTVSILAIKFLMSYIKRHDFKVFGWYRIVLGLLVIAYFTLIK